MKLTRKINVAMLILWCFLSGGAGLRAQSPVADYIGKAGAFSRLYSGQIVSRYSPAIYQGTPYYNGDNYVKGTVVFNGVVYPDINIILDLYKQQALIVNPANYIVVIPHEKIQNVCIGDKTFVWVAPGKDSGLKNAGFYISYFDSQKVGLLCEERFSIPDDKAMPVVFEKKVRYYLKVEGKYHLVRNKGDFLGLFPTHKKQISKYAKDNRLDFKNDKAQSMTALAAYCNKL